MSQVTHRNGHQIVSVDALRQVLRASGERCYCALDSKTEWDAGKCPEHRVETAQPRSES